MSADSSSKEIEVLQYLLAISWYFKKIMHGGSTSADHNGESTLERDRVLATFLGKYIRTAGGLSNVDVHYCALCRFGGGPIDANLENRLIGLGALSPWEALGKSSDHCFDRSMMFFEENADTGDTLKEEYNQCNITGMKTLLPYVVAGVRIFKILGTLDEANFPPMDFIYTSKFAREGGKLSQLNSDQLIQMMQDFCSSFAEELSESQIDAILQGIEPPEHNEPHNVAAPEHTETNQSGVEFKKAILLQLSAFNMYLEKLGDKVIDLKNRGFHEESEVANNLIKKLESEANKLNDSSPTIANINVFHAECSQAIKYARPTLESHRGWKQTLGNIALAVVGLGVFYALALIINKHTTGQYLFFKTDSEQLLDKLESSSKKQPG